MDTETNLKEYWKPCSNYAGYEVSTFGNVRESKKEIYALYDDCKVLIQTIPTKLVRPYFNKQGGYFMVLLGNKNNFHRIAVHRLVAENFLTNELDKKCIVNHIDGNLKNNHVSNLEYVSYEDYIKCNKSKYTPKMIIYTPIKCITTGQYFSSIKDASIYFKIPYTHLRMRLYNKHYSWKYEEDFVLVDKQEVLNVINSEKYVKINEKDLKPVTIQDHNKTSTT